MFLWIRKSIKNKLMFLVMAIILFLGATTVAITFFSNRNILIAEGRESLRSLATESSYVSDKNVNLYIDVTKIMSAQPSVVASAESPNLANNQNVVSLLKKQNVDNMFNEISILDLKGRVSASTNTMLVGKDYSSYSFFERAMRGEISIGYTADFQKDEVVFYTFAPIKKESGVNIGFIVGQLPQDSLFSGLTSGESLAHSSNQMVVDSNGLIVYSKNKDYMLKGISEMSGLEKENIAKYSLEVKNEIVALQYDMVKEDINNYRGPANYTSTDKKNNAKEMIAISKMESLPLFNVMGRNESEAGKPAQGKTVPIAVFALLTVIFSALSIEFFVGWLLRPIDVLKKVLRSIGRGHLDQDVNIKTVDEFRELGDAVVLMTLELKEKEAINIMRGKKDHPSQ